MIGDRGYDSSAFVESLENKECKVVIPPKSNRKVQREYDKHTYKERHLIECFFNIYTTNTIEGLNSQLRK